MEKHIVHPLLGKISFVKRLRCRRLKILISSERGVRVSVPYFIRYSDALRFLEANAGKVSKYLQKLKERESKMSSVEETPRNYTNEELQVIRAKAKAILPAMLQESAAIMDRLFKDEFGRTATGSMFRYNRVSIKNNRSNWGSCSVLRNINLNMHLANLPPDLCRYVILHELSHLVYLNHGKNFHSLLDRACRQIIGESEKELAKEIRKHNFMLRRIGIKKNKKGKSQ